MYTFHLALQNHLRALFAQDNQLRSVRSFIQSRQEIEWHDVHQIVEAWRQARAVFAFVLRAAAELSPPAMKGWKVGETLSRILPAQPSAPELDPVQTSLNVVWSDQLHSELTAVIDKLSYVLIKSLVRILQCQDELAKEWESQDFDQRPSIPQ